MNTLPNQQTREWNQANQSDLFGNIHITKNITFDTEGYLRLSYSSRASMNETIDADFDNPAVILLNEDYNYFVATWDSAFETSIEILSEYPTQIATAGVPSTDEETDATFFGGLMPVSQDTDLDYYDVSAGTWTDTNISLTGDGQHPIVNFLSLSALAVADVNTVKLYASPLNSTPNPILITTLTISADFQITGMCYFNQNLYIATQNIYGGHAVMYVWNGLGTAANQVYEADSNAIFSICAHQNGIVCLTGNGSLLRFNGGGFDPLPNGNFPIYYIDQSLTDEGSLNIYKNCLKSNGNLLYILFTNSDNNSNRLLNQPDGIWCYDERVGLYHRYSLSNSLVLSETIDTSRVNTTTNQITLNTMTAPVTGTEMYYKDDGGPALAPLVNDGKYFVIRIDSTHIQIAETYADAVAGINIDLTTTGVFTQRMIFYPNVDFGQYWSNRVTALNVIERPVSQRQYGVDLLWGGEVYRRNTNTDYGTLGTVADHIGSRGYFITPKIYSTDVTDVYNQITLKFSPFTTELDKIIMKYRNYDDMREFINISNSNYWAITWTSVNTFTTTFEEFGLAEVGNEIEVLRGAAGGLLAHITAISENAGTYTITIDENYDNYASGDVSRAVFRNWIKWKTIEYGDSNALKAFISDQLGKDGKFLQMKIELRGVRTRIEELLIDNKYRLPKQPK